VNASADVMRLCDGFLTGSGADLTHWVPRRIGGEIDMSEGANPVFRLRRQQPDKRRRM